MLVGIKDSAQDFTLSQFKVAERTLAQVQLWQHTVNDVHVINIVDLSVKLGQQVFKQGEWAILCRNGQVVSDIGWSAVDEELA